MTPTLWRPKAVPRAGLRPAAKKENIKGQKMLKNNPNPSKSNQHYHIHYQAKFSNLVENVTIKYLRQTKTNYKDRVKISQSKM